MLLFLPLGGWLFYSAQADGVLTTMSAFGAFALGASTDVTRKTTTVGYDYNLSKRTEVYAVYMNDKQTGLNSGNSVGAGIRLTY